MKNLIAKFFPQKDTTESKAVVDKKIIEDFVSNPANPFLVSFPRTGSHWLRMVMEVYFGQPSLVRVFYYPNQTNYLTLHTHDMNLDVEHKNVIYLYRSPVDTIYSQMSYEKDDLEDQERIKYWGGLYGRHLEKWLITENFTTQKTIIRYERLKDDANNEFEKICIHLGQKFNPGQLEKAMARVTKEKVKEKTSHDPSVMTIGEQYEQARQLFHNKYANLVWDITLNKRLSLKNFLE